MDYKKIFKNKEIRFRILSMLRFIPDKYMLQLQYGIKNNRKLNLKTPQRYTEKIQWYKLYYRNPIMQQCADKFAVREYVKAKGLGYILNELYAVFANVNDISFENLPEKFVLKLSNGSGTNLFCADKNKYDLKNVQHEFKTYIAQRKAAAGREWVYNGTKSLIVAERYLEEPGQKGLVDYKIFCFGGKPEYIICVGGRHTDNYHHVIYDASWSKQDVQVGGSLANVTYPKPDKLEEMLRIARILSEDFPAARVDLYLVQEQIYFGEITFFPWSGYMDFKPDSFDFELGKKFVLPKQNH